MTYNTDAPNGLVPLQSTFGSTWNGQLTEYNITATNATAMYQGDPVTLSTLGTVTVGLASTPSLGIFMGCKFNTSAGVHTLLNYWPGNPGIQTGSTPTALILDDPGVVMTIQETDAAGASGTPLTAGAIGLNANFLYTAGSAANGISAVSLNNASIATTIVQNLQVRALDPTPGNAIGAFANWLVTWNTHLYKAGSVRPV